MDDETFKQLFGPQVECQAHLRTILFFMAEAIAHTKSISVENIRNQVLDFGEQSIVETVGQMSSLEKRLQDDKAMLMEYLAANRGLMKTLSHYQVRIVARFRGLDVDDVQKEFDQEYEKNMSELS